MITENVSTLKINKLTNEQYNRELDAGNIDENALYLTPDDTYSKAEVEAMMPKVVVGNVELVPAAGSDSNYSYCYITSTELNSMKKNLNEFIIYLIPNTTISFNEINNPTYIKLGANDGTTITDIVKWFDGGYWVDANIDGISVPAGYCMIFAVTGSVTGSMFNSIKWLNPPRG